MASADYTPGSNLDQFRSYIGSRMFQPPNSYIATFMMPSSAGSKILVSYPDNVILPDQTIQPIDDNTWASPRKLPTRSVYGEVLMSFILMKDWAERQYFEDWFDWITPHSRTGLQGENILSFPADSYDRSVGTCYIDFLSPGKRAITKTYATKEIYPITLTPLSFSSDSTGYATFQVVFYVRNMRNAQTIN